MKGLFLALGGAFTLFAATSLACGAGSTQPDLLVSDPQVLLDQAQAAMADLDSYRAAFGVPARPDDIQEEYRWEIEYEAPDSYRVLLFAAEGEREERCESYVLPDGSGSGRTCYEILTSITSQTVAETIVVGDTIYGRRCKDIDKECDRWQEQPRGPIVIPALSYSFLPQWPLVALEMAAQLELAGQDTVDGVPLIHLQGSVNHLRAVLENERRVLTAAGTTSFGETCTVEVSSPGEPPGERTCRELTFEESLEGQEPQLSFYDENLSTIDIWLSPDDLLVHRIAITIPPHELPDQETAFTIEYSLFNQVEIEAPR